MKDVKLFLVIFVIVASEPVVAQTVDFIPGGQIIAGNTLSISVLAPADTGSRKTTGKIVGAFFINDTYFSNEKTFQLKMPPNGFKDSLILKDQDITNGNHTFFISTPDGYTRAYSSFVTTGLKNQTESNLNERIVFNISDNDLQSFFKKLNDEIVNGDSAKIVKLLPLSFKGLVCIDFVASATLGGNEHQFSAIITKYQFANNGGVSNFDDFFKFISANNKAILSYLNTGWQMSPDAFATDVEKYKNQIFSDPSKYTIITNKKDFSSRLLVGYDDTGKNFYRVIFFVNN